MKQKNRKDHPIMLNAWKPGNSFINKEIYRDKVLGCWTGKNIGGTLGAPMEGKTEIFDISFYTQDLSGEPAPNDDLDLQLAWLTAIEEHGIYNINERLLGEYWLGHITGPWNEYGVGKFNMVNGLLPPLSGLCNNERWKNSNGAWIRSEIWACMFPGEIDEVVPYAWYDSCVDHCDEGIYAEIFTAVLESGAFIESDLRKLTEYAFARIPADCRVARSVKIVIDAYDNGEDWKTARNRVVEDSADLGWFQAPANVAFTILGLLYGNGDFGKSVCLAVNCGDDTDCTGATCGAILGIMYGRSGIPEEWVKPIGESIKTISVNPFRLAVPATLSELTDRVIRCKEAADIANPAVIRLTDGETYIEDAFRKQLDDPSECLARLSGRSSRRVTMPLPYGLFAAEYENSPIMKEGDTQKIILSFAECRHENASLKVEWLLPEGWSIAEGNTQYLMGYFDGTRKLEINITAGAFDDAFVHIPLVFRISGRNYPVYGTLTFQRAGAVEANGTSMYHGYIDPFARVCARRGRIFSWDVI